MQQTNKTHIRLIKWKHGSGESAKPLVKWTHNNASNIATFRSAGHCTYWVNTLAMEYQVIEKAMYLTKFNPFRQLSSGNRTTGSQCYSLVGQAHPSESCQVLTLTLWIPGQTLTAATNTANFIQNASVLRRLVYGPFKLTHISHDDHTAH